MILSRWQSYSSRKSHSSISKPKAQFGLIRKCVVRSAYVRSNCQSAHTGIACIFASVLLLFSMHSAACLLLWLLFFCFVLFPFLVRFVRDQFVTRVCLRVCLCIISQKCIAQSYANKKKKQNKPRKKNNEGDTQNGVCVRTTSAYMYLNDMISIIRSNSSKRVHIFVVHGMEPNGMCGIAHTHAHKPGWLIYINVDDMRSADASEAHAFAL